MVAFPSRDRHFTELELIQPGDWSMIQQEPVSVEFSLNAGSHVEIELWFDQLIDLEFGISMC